MKGKVTIKDVAKLSGVSIATVSNVLNNVNNRASEATKQKVMNAIKELDYKMDFNARSLSSRKSNMIGIMLPITQEGDVSTTLLTNNPFYGEFINGVELSARERGYDILIMGVYKSYSCREWIIKRNLDGIIFLGMYPQNLYDEMKTLEVPVVLIDTYEAYTSQFHNIGIDDEDAGYKATKYLLEIGHKNIAFVSGSIDKSIINLKRFNGYKRALNEFGVQLNPKYVIETTVGFDGGKEAGERILRRKIDVTAIFSVADIMAMGLIKVFTKVGKKVPEDFSVIGFDDLKICDYTTPGLTTIRQNIFKKGKVAAKVLIEDIEGINKKPQSIHIPTELVIRESTKSK